MTYVTIVFQVFHTFLDYLLLMKYISIAFAKHRISKRGSDIFRFLLDPFDLFRGVNKMIVAKRNTHTHTHIGSLFLTFFDQVTFHPSVTSYPFEEDPSSKFCEGCAKILFFFQLRRQYWLAPGFFRDLQCFARCRSAFVAHPPLFPTPHTSCSFRQEDCIEFRSKRLSAHIKWILLYGIWKPL